LAPPASAAIESPAIAAHTSTLDGVDQGIQLPLVNAAAIEAAKRRAAAVPAKYRVQAGDTLSSIAGQVYHNRAAWPVIYWRNHTRIKWANDIHAGEVLNIPARPEHIPNPPAQLEPKPVVSSAPAATGSTSVSQSSATYSGTYPGGAFGACVVAHESGGNPQIMNSTGHYGLYQFSAATWAAYGGNPADFGHASVAEQNQVFANALAAGGQSNWAPYDGC